MAEKAQTMRKIAKKMHGQISRTEKANNIKSSNTTNDIRGKY